MARKPLGVVLRVAEQIIEDVEISGLVLQIGRIGDTDRWILRIWTAQVAGGL